MIADGLVSRRSQGWPLRCECGVRWRFKATPWRRRARGHTGMDRADVAWPDLLVGADWECGCAARALAAGRRIAV